MARGIFKPASRVALREMHDPNDDGWHKIMAVGCTHMSIVAHMSISTSRMAACAPAHVR